MIQKISVVALGESEAKEALINPVTADDLTSLSALNCVCVAFSCQQSDTYVVYN